MLRPTAALAVLTVLVCPCLARDLAINGGFEDGLAGYVAHVNATIDEADPHGGERCVRIDGKPGENSFVQQDFAVDAGRNYRLDLWAKCRDVPDDADAKAYYNLFSDDRLLDSYAPLPRLSGTTRWQQVGCEIRIPAGADKCSVILQIHDSAGTVWFDDVSFTPLLSAEEQSIEKAVGDAQRRTAELAVSRLAAAPEVAPGVRLSEPTDTGGLFLSCGRTALTFGPGDRGYPLRSLVDIPTKTEFIVPGGRGELFRLELRPGQPYTYSGAIAGPGRATHRVEQADGAVRLILDYEPCGGAQATVTIEAAEGRMPRWRIDVKADPGLSVWLVDFPQIDRLGPCGDRDSEYLALPSGQGRLQLDPRGTVRYSEGWADYPGAGKTMQFEAYCAPSQGCGLYLCTEDSRMHRKATGYFGAGDWVAQSVRHYPESMGTCSEYHQPYDVVLGSFAGDWYDACRLYRSWALQQPWSAAGPVEARADMPDWLRHLGAWGQGDMPGTTAEEMQPQVRRVAQFARTVEAPIAFHAYIWQSVGRHDANYPVLEPKPGFAQAVRDMQAAGVRVIPYINVYSADAAGPAWRVLDLVDLTLRPPLTRAYSDMTGLVPMCPATKQWQGIIKAECEKLMAQLPVDGLYLDQLTGAPYVCFDPDHGHTVGGGTHFADGMRQVATEALAAVRAKRPDGITFGENCNEIYNDKTLAHLTWAEMEVATRLPMFTAVYSDRVIRLGCFIGRPDTWGDAGGYYSKLAYSFTSGEQLGWIMFGILSNFDDPELAPLRAYLRDLAKTRVAALQYLCYGEMLRPPVLSVPGLPVEWNWFSDTHKGLLPAVLCQAWRAPNGNVAVALCNRTAEDREVTVPTGEGWQASGETPRLCQAGEWSKLEGLRAGEVRMTVPAHSALVVEPGMALQ